MADAHDTMSGVNHSLVRTVRDKGMQQTPDYMANLVRWQGQDGVVEARDFVDQLDRLMPGEGTKAIRGILQSLADIPGLQRAFFGGPVIETAPIGVFEQDGQLRYEQALKDRPWEDYELGRKIPGDGEVRDMAYRPPTPASRDAAELDEEEPETEENDEGEESSDRENHDESSRARAFQVASGPAATMTDAGPQVAQSQQSRPSITRGENAWVYNDPNDIKERARQNGGWLGRDRQCVALLQGTNPNLGHTSTWRAGDQIRGPGDPPLQPGTAIATFQPDKRHNGELRYPSPEGQDRAANERVRRHAGIYMGHGEQNGRPGIFILDQFDGTGRDNRGDQGETAIRFYPFERPNGQGGYRAGEFHVIRPDQGRQR